MKPSDYINYLIGYLEAAGDNGLTPAQVKYILSKLKLYTDENPNPNLHMKC